MRCSWMVALAVVAGCWIGSVSEVQAGGRHRRCDTCYAPAASCDECAPSEPKMVERTIMVPQTVTEKRKIHRKEYRNETREKTVTVVNRVPKTESVTREYTVMVPKKMTKTVEYQVCKPVVKVETREYTVMVPHKEQREGVRHVCKRVPVEKTRKITVDEGHWEEQASECGDGDDCGDGCGGCGHRRKRRWCGSCGASSGCNVWVPNVVEKEVTYTCYQNVTEEQPYTYHVTVCKPEKRTREVELTDYVMEPKTKEVTYTKYVAEKRSKTCDVTRYECVPTEKTVSYTVCVPHHVEKEVDVEVIKMVPKTVLVPEDCGGGRSCYRGRRCRGC